MDSASLIVLDADNADNGIQYKDGGTEMLRIHNSSSDVIFHTKVQDKDFIIKGDDGGSDVTALTIDMSDAGTATFNHDVILANDSFIQFGDAGETIAGNGTAITITSSEDITLDAASEINLDAGNSSIRIKDDGTEYGRIHQTAGGGLTIKSQTNDKDIQFEGIDNSSGIVALKLDMSDAGTAIFNHDLVIADAGFIGSASDTDAIAISSSGVVTFSQTPVNSAGAAFVTDDPTALAIALG